MSGDELHTLREISRLYHHIVDTEGGSSRYKYLDAINYCYINITLIFIR